jgi:DNA-binding NarL/FixJ family response regulator
MFMNEGDRVNRPRPVRAASERVMRLSGAISVVVVAAERLFIEGLLALLGSQPSINVVGQAAQAAQAIAVVQRVRPDVVLLDPNVTEMDYVELIRRIRQYSPDVRTLLLTAARAPVDVGRAVRAGARGYISKNATLADLTKAIDGVHRGDVWVPAEVLADVLWGNGHATAPSGRSGEAERLTAREREILGLLASGGTNRHIAEALFISEKTVKTHLRNIFRKLKVTRRLQAVLYAVRHDLRES